ncbi:MAG: ABC transporter ATP-binding protein/permease [Acidobacteria bacterium]|nr:ABC transporter ATP-binding protein/permease [Acidobacteriota bacterium]MDW7984430.1 ABC transporter ATP-binding protein [Acidobacteriota bacterium]
MATARRWRDDFRVLYRYVRPYRPAMAGLVLLMTLVGATNAGMTYLIRWVMDTLIIQLDFRRLPTLVGAVLLIYVVRALAMYHSTAVSRTIGARVVYDVRRRLFLHVLEQPTSFFRRFPSGQLSSRMTHDGTVLQQGITEVFIDVILEGFKAIAIVLYIFWLNWRLALITLVAVLLLVVPLVVIGHRLRRITEQFHGAVGDLNHRFHQVLQGLRVIQAYWGQARERRQFEQKTDALLRLQRRWVFWNALHAPIVEVCLGIALFGLIVYGAYQIRWGNLTPGGFTSFVAAMLMVYTPLRRLSKLNDLLQQTATAAHRIEQVLHYDLRLPEAATPAALPVARGELRFEGVGFWYPGRSTPALIDVNLSVAAGETVAIIGSSGAGKSTLAQLIPRLMDVTEGAVYLDGHDVRTLRLRELRTHVGWVPQEVFLFEDTVFNNIAYGWPEATGDDVIRAARQAHAHEFILQLPEGYQTIIGGEATGLSGGQAQRIALARALVRRPRVLVLDEVTSALDSESEGHIQAALAELKGTCTMILIGHRWSMLRLADRIVVMDKGRIVDEGTHDELLRRCALYRRLWRRQVAVR